MCITPTECCRGENKITRMEIEWLKKDPEFMASLKRGIEDLKAGRMVPWEQVRKELGIG